MALLSRAGPWPIFDIVGLAGGLRESGVIGVFVCYLDDSDAELSSIVTLAGYVARLEEWRQFERDVSPIFDRYEVTVLHSKELNDTKGCFAGWQRWKKEAFIHDLFAVAARYVPFGVSVSIRKAQIKKWRRANPRERPNSAYGICFNAILNWIVMSNGLRSAIQRDGLSFIVEAGHANNGEIENLFHHHSKHGVYAGIARSISFADKKSARAIQMADFFAFHSRRFGNVSERFGGNILLPAQGLYKIAREYLFHFSAVATGEFTKVNPDEAINPPLLFVHRVKRHS